MAFFSLVNSLNFFAATFEIVARLLRLVADFLDEWTEVKGEPLFEGTKARPNEPDFGPLLLLIVGLWLGSRYHLWLNRAREEPEAAGATALAA